MKEDVALLIGLILFIGIGIGVGNGGIFKFNSKTAETCTSLSRTLTQGDTDTKTGGEVTKLQKFFIANNYGYATTTSGVFDGYTFNAVIKYQKDENIDQTGAVGPKTRLAIKEDSCPKPVAPSPTPKAELNPPNISYLSKSSGPMGTFVTIYGSNFNKGLNTIIFGKREIATSSPDGSKISFFVPQNLSTQSCPNNESCYIPAGSQTSVLGSYQVIVSNERGDSNTSSFTVTSGTSIGGVASSEARPRILNFTGPSSMDRNDTGVWTLILENKYSPSLLLTINWGDETGVSTRQINIQGQRTIQLSHSYKNRGSYSITIKLEDDLSGQYETRSSSINIAATSDKVSELRLNSVYPSSAQAGSTVVLEGTGFSGSDMKVIFDKTTISNVSVYNRGTTLSFTVPNLKSGSYQFYVINSYGQITDKRYFTITD